MSLLHLIRGKVRGLVDPIGVHLDPGLVLVGCDYRAMGDDDFLRASVD